MKLKANKSLSLILQSAVYLAFFSVQFFYNFDGQGHSKVIPGVVSASVSSSKANVSLEKSKGNSTQKVNFRLNKRFQPKQLAESISLDTAAPYQYLVSPKLGLFCSQYLPSNIHNSHTLRGPPSVA